VLIILSGLTFFQIEIYASLIFAIAAIIVGVMAIKGTDFIE
jgi:hypothetical protein